MNKAGRIALPAALCALTMPSGALAQTAPAADAAASTPPAQPAATTTQDGPRFEVDTFTLEYAQGSAAALPDLANVSAAARARVRPASNGELIEVDESAPAVPLASLPSGRYSIAALNEVAKAVVDQFNEAGYYAISVAPREGQLDESTGEDLRGGARAFVFVVTVPTVADVRTLAFGSRVNALDRINAPQHAKIRNASPLKAGTGQESLFRKEPLDNFVYRLNRQPGRRVDVALSAGTAPGTVTLDYLVTENRPWYVYAQVSNTGTESTSEWRERFGFAHNQVTGNDDIFSLDYSTAGFEESHAVTAAYDFPLKDFHQVRGKVYGTWSEFTASDVGFIDQSFEGDEWSVGGEVAVNVKQWRESFLDVVGGIRYQDIGIENIVGGASVSSGDAGFVEPYAGVRFERRTDASSTFADAILTYGFTSADDDELDVLRTDADDRFFTLQASVNHSFFLEPLIDRRDFDAGKSTLAHEVFFGLRGQYAFGHRLVPQIEETAGGLYSVRGYQESVTAGDSAIIATAEYRFHVPRSLGVRPEPQNLPLVGNFRVAPQQPYGRPDWDFIIRPFIDAAYIANTNALPFEEEDNTLVGTGIGIEIQFTDYFNLRCDWGIALTDVEANGTDEVTSGSNRFHFVFTLVY